MFRLWTFFTFVFNLAVCTGVLGAMIYVVAIKPVAEANDPYALIFGALVLFASMTNCYFNFLYLFRRGALQPHDGLAALDRADERGGARVIHFGTASRRRSQG